MRVPIGWLRDYVDFDVSAEELARKLTFSGLEVEAIETVGGDWKNIVVAEVSGVTPHPDADNLMLCRASDGKEEVQVVCGAPNLRNGDKVPLARKGAVLANGTKIKKTKIRGEESNGMLCAEDELGISEDHSGLMVLPSDATPGTAISELLGPPEEVLVIEVTSNRPDCLSLVGVAREVAALCGTALKMPAVDFEETSGAVDDVAKVTVDDEEGCPRYTARVLRDVKIGPSPMAMQMRLIQGGMRPINNIVDITNYVLLECGQPLHAFDRELIDGGEIIVRRASAGETMKTLDDVERKLSADMLLIADKKRAVAVAGVMGGAGSEIRDETSEVLLESAYFQPLGIHRTSVALGLSTESSYRFERGVDIGLVDWASRRATSLMVSHAGASVISGVIDVNSKQPADRRVTCRYQKARDLIGVDVSDAEIVGILKSLELEVTEEGPESCTVSIPSFRGDLDIEADLIEEVARIHGLDKIEVRPPRSATVFDVDDSAIRASYACAQALVGAGLTEIMNYSFISPGLADLFADGDREKRIILPNPSSADQSIMRTSLVPQMVESLGKNLAHQTSEACLFEIGRTFRQAGKGRSSEDTRICVGIMGPVGRGIMDKRKEVNADEVFLWLKGIVEAVCSKLRVPSLSLEAAMAGWADDAASVMSGSVTLGVMGIVSGAIRKEWRMTDPIAVAELSLDALVEHYGDVCSVTEIPVYPSVTRDMAVIVDRAVKNADVLKIVSENAPAELTDTQLFDMFESEGIGAGKKSMAYTFRYRSLERTLTDEEVNRLHESVKAHIVRELKAEVRES